MDEEDFGWPLLGAANHDGMIHYFQGMARMPQPAADSNITAISPQGLTHFYPMIYQSYSSRADNLQHLIDSVQSLAAQLGMDAESAQCKSVQKPHAIHPETPDDPTGASKYF